MSRLRVVYLDHVAQLSGGEIALSRLLPALAGDVEAHVILGEDGPLVIRLRELGVSVEVLAIDEAVRDARKDAMTIAGIDRQAVATWAAYIASLRRRLREVRPDLVHTNSLKAAIYGGVAGRAAGVPVVWHIRDRIAKDYLPAPAVRMVQAASRVLPSAIIANSRTTLETLPRSRRRAVVSNAVAHDSVPTVRRQTDVRDWPLRIGMTGRLAPWKGQDIFLEAFAQACEHNTVEAWLIGSAMFGEDAYAAQLRTQVQRLGLTDRVTFTGFRDDIFAELEQIDILVHASVIAEPFGQVVLEGMAAGVPVIATRAGGPAEIVTEGVNGLLVTPGSVGELAAALRRLVDQPQLRASLAQKGIATAAAYTSERAASQVLAVYAGILTPGR